MYEEEERKEVMKEEEEVEEKKETNGGQGKMWIRERNKHAEERECAEPDKRIRLDLHPARRYRLE